MDWKDTLAALGASGTLPEGEEPTNVGTTNCTSEEIQQTPLVVYLDRKKRHGKEATIIEGFVCDGTQLKERARELKQQLGCGGSQRNGEILLQGDVRAKVTEALVNMGFKVKRGN